MIIEVVARGLWDSHGVYYEIRRSPTGCVRHYIRDGVDVAPPDGVEERPHPSGVGTYWAAVSYADDEVSCLRAMIADAWTEAQQATDAHGLYDILERLAKAVKP